MNPHDAAHYELRLLGYEFSGGYYHRECGPVEVHLLPRRRLGGVNFEVRYDVQGFAGYLADKGHYGDARAAHLSVSEKLPALSSLFAEASFADATS